MPLSTQSTLRGPLPAPTRDLLHRTGGSKLSRHYAARGNRRYSPHRFAFLGTSITEGYTTPATIDDSFTRLFEAQWRQRWPVITTGGVPVTTGGHWINNGQLYTPFTVAGGTVNCNTSPMVWGGYGLSIPVGGTAVFTEPGTSAGLFILRQSGGGTITATGPDVVGSPLAISTAGSAQDMHEVNIPFTNGTGPHTVTLTGSVAASVIDGVYVYNGDELAGSLVFNGGHGGSTTNYMPVTGPNAAYWWGNFAQAFSAVGGVDTWIIEYGGVNDYLGNFYSPAQVKANLQPFFTNLAAYSSSSGAASPSIVLLATWQPGTLTNRAAGNGGVNGWQPYLDNLYSFEASYPFVSVLDLGKRVPDPAVDNTAGMFYTDFTHPLKKGRQWIADQLVDFLS